MFKKIKRFIEDLIEKIFKRKELQKFKTQADLLEKEVEDKAGIIEDLDIGRQELTQKVFLLINGQAVNLTQQERQMIKDAIEHKSFRAIIELPATKAQTRIIWRSLREKITISIIEEVDLADKEDDEVKEDDETKQA